MVTHINIAGRKIGPGVPCFIIAEAGVNHNGDMKMARQLIDVAVHAGADAIKFQTFNADLMVSPNALKAEYQMRTTGGNESQYQMLKRLELNQADHQELMDYCKKMGILFLSTPFDEQSADLLDRLRVPAFKIPSGEITNLPFLDYVASKEKPIILSTGMSTLGEVETAVNTIKNAGNHNLLLLHCVSNYPAYPKDCNLRAINSLSAAFGVPAGFSDHTQGMEISIAAVALGACVIEKHFTLDRNLPGPDHRFSLKPDELKTLVENIRTVEKAMGHGRKEPVKSESNTAAAARKSLIATRRIPQGTKITRDMVAIKRPGTGIAPSFLPIIVGMKTTCDIEENSVFLWEHFNG